MLGRDTSWRQGCVLSTELVSGLQLCDETSEDIRVVVISHDCDIPHAAESKIDVIVGRTVNVADGNFIGGKNPRKLHLSFECAATNSTSVIELEHTKSERLCQRPFVNATPDDGFVLLDKDKTILKQWLASRYGRPAYPNAFENRLQRKVGQKTVESKLSKILQQISHCTVAVYFDLNEDRQTEHEESDPYYLGISIIYNTLEQPIENREEIESKLDAIRQLFDDANTTGGPAGQIILDSCDCISDAEYSIADIRRTDQWRVEHISLNSDVGEPILVRGDMPG